MLPCFVSPILFARSFIGTLLILHMKKGYISSAPMLNQTKNDSLIVTLTTLGKAYLEIEDPFSTSLFFKIGTKLVILAPPSFYTIFPTCAVDGADHGSQPYMKTWLSTEPIDSSIS